MCSDDGYHLTRPCPEQWEQLHQQCIAGSYGWRIGQDCIASQSVSYATVDGYVCSTPYASEHPGRCRPWWAVFRFPASNREGSGKQFHTSSSNVDQIRDADHQPHAWYILSPLAAWICSWWCYVPLPQLFTGGTLPKCHNNNARCVRSSQWKKYNNSGSAKFVNIYFSCL